MTQHEQLDFDAIAAGAERERGMDEAYRAERVQLWKAAAGRWLLELLPGTLFTADDLVAAIGLPDEGVARNNVVGAWIAAQSKLGLIVWTKQFRHSERVIGHRNLLRVWRVR